jgi:hypothetical protein
MLSLPGFPSHSLVVPARPWHRASQVRPRVGTVQGPARGRVRWQGEERVALLPRDIQLRLSQWGYWGPLVHNMRPCVRAGEDPKAWKQFGPKPWARAGPLDIGDAIGVCMCVYFCSIGAREGACSGGASTQQPSILRLILNAAALAAASQLCSTLLRTKAPQDFAEY